MEPIDEIIEGLEIAKALDGGAHGEHDELHIALHQKATVAQEERLTAMNWRKQEDGWWVHHASA